MYEVRKTFFSSHHLSTEPALNHLVFNKANTVFEFYKNSLVDSVRNETATLHTSMQKSKHIKNCIFLLQLSTKVGILNNKINQLLKQEVEI